MIDLLLYYTNQELASRCVSVLSRNGFHIRTFDNVVQARACLFVSHIDIVLIASLKHPKESNGLQNFIRDQNLRIPIFFLEPRELINRLNNQKNFTFALEPANEFALKLRQLLLGFTEGSMNNGTAKSIKRNLKRSHHLADFKLAKATFEREFLIDALHKYKGNVSQTANAIGIARRNLQLRLRKFNINARELRQRLR